MNLKLKILPKKYAINSLFILRTNKNVDKINVLTGTEIDILNIIDVTIEIFTVEFTAW